MKHQEHRGEETLIKPKYIVKYKNLLIFKSAPPSVSLSACGNHRHVEGSPFFWQFRADSSTAFLEAVKNALRGLICQPRDEGKATAPERSLGDRGGWEKMQAVCQGWNHSASF